MGQGSFLWFVARELEAMSSNWNTESCTCTSEKNFLHWGRAVTLLPSGGSFSGGIQNLPGYNPWQCALDCHAKRRSIGVDDSKLVLPNSAILGFCDKGPFCSYSVCNNKLCAFSYLFIVHNYLSKLITKFFRKSNQLFIKVWNRMNMGNLHRWKYL